MGFCSLILGNQSLGQDELEAASRLFEESHIYFRQSGRSPDIAKSLDRLGFVSWVKGDYENAARLLGESRDLSNALGNRWYVATTTVNLSQVALSQGRFVLAGELLGEALPLLTELKDVYHASVALHHQAVIARCNKDYPRALLLLEQSAAPLRELGDPLFLNYCMGERGIVVWLQGKLNEALQLLRQSAAVSLQMRDKANLAKWIEALAGLCGDGGELLRAATLSGAAEALREEIGAPLEPYERADHSRRLEALRSSLGRAQFEKASAAGRALPLEDLLPSVPEWLEPVHHSKQYVATERRQGRNPAR
jgi:tetratricopeptide (TPR) repeat protein